MSKIKCNVSPDEIYSCPIDKDKILYEYPLPKMSKFRSRSKKNINCPYFKLQMYINKQLKRKAKVSPLTVITNVSQLVLHNDTAVELNKEVIRWLKVRYPLLSPTSRQFEQVYLTVHLNYGPTTSTDSHIKKGRIYIRQ